MVTCTNFLRSADYQWTAVLGTPPTPVRRRPEASLTYHRIVFVLSLFKTIADKPSVTFALVGAVFLAHLSCRILDIGGTTSVFVGPYCSSASKCTENLSLLVLIFSVVSFPGFATVKPLSQIGLFELLRNWASNKGVGGRWSLKVGFSLRLFYLASYSGPEGARVKVSPPFVVFIFGVLNSCSATKPKLGYKV